MPKEPSEPQIYIHTIPFSSFPLSHENPYVCCNTVTVCGKFWLCEKKPLRRAATKFREGLNNCFLACEGASPLRRYFPYRAVRSARRDKGNTRLPPVRGSAPQRPGFGIIQRCIRIHAEGWHEQARQTSQPKPGPTALPPVQSGEVSYACPKSQARLAKQRAK